MRRVQRALVVVLAVVWSLGSPSPAFADPPQPTDYRTLVTAIVPATVGFEAAIVGGDSFVELTVVRGVSVDVPGYAGEPYLRFTDDGTVEENQASPTFYANSSRYGGDVPVGAADAEADWVTVATSGRYAWHDHRIHWMSSSSPAGKHPGDVILDAELPVVVGGTPVLIHVRSTWLRPPSRVPALVGLLSGLAVAAALWKQRRSVRVLSAGVAVVAALALLFGGLAFGAVPPGTGPPFTLWFLPAVTVSVLAVTTLLRRRSSQWVLRASVAVAATPLTMWGWMRREAMWRAYIPTDAPFWADRVTVGFVLAAAAMCVLGLMIDLSRHEPVRKTRE